MGAALWGLFWLPLRYLESLGISALWALVLVMTAALVPAMVLCKKQCHVAEIANPSTWIAGSLLGLATTLYFIALLYTDVVRVVFLFYLLPVWTTLSARFIYGESIRAAKIIVIIIALCGLWLLLSAGQGLVFPVSIADWCAIASGMCWGISLSLLRAYQQGSARARTMIAIATAVTLSLLAVSLLHLTGSVQITNVTTHVTAASDTQNFSLAMIALVTIAFGMLAVYPAMLAQIWGASQLPAPTAALLTMSEIIVAIGSAYLLIGTSLTPVAMSGGVIILLALCIDIFMELFGKSSATTGA